MKAFFLTVFSLLLGTAAMAHPAHGGHLTFFGGAVHAHLSWVEGPHDGAESKLRLEWREGANHGLVDPGFPFAVDLWMPSMNHGSAPTQLMRVLDAQGNVQVGVYEVTNIYFLMPGPWEVRVSAKPEGVAGETRAWNVVIEGEGHGGHH